MWQFRVVLVVWMLRRSRVRVWLSYEEGCCWGEKKKGGLLYFRGCFAGRVRVACRLLYSIFKVGWGLLYFCDIFGWEFFDVF